MSVLFSILMLQVVVTQPMAAPDRRPAKLQLWDHVQDVSSFIQSQVKGKVEGVEIGPRDSVKSYLMGSEKLVVIIPLHHVASRHKADLPMTDENASTPLNVPERIPSLKEQARKARTYRENQKRIQAIKEANFERFLTEIKNLIESLKIKLLPFDMPLSLHLVVEESDRLWIASPLKGQAQYQRKVVTLEVTNLLEFDPLKTEILETRYIRTLKDPGKKRTF